MTQQGRGSLALGELWRRKAWAFSRCWTVGWSVEGLCGYDVHLELSWVL